MVSENIIKNYNIYRCIIHKKFIYIHKCILVMVQILRKKHLYHCELIEFDDGSE